MTTPQQPPPQQQQQQQQQQLAMQVASVLATAGVAGTAAATLAPAFATMGIRHEELREVLSIVMGHPPEAAGFYGHVTSQAARLNLMRRAQFVIASARRVHAAAVAARSEDRSIGQAIMDAASDERRYYGQHLVAMWARNQAAARIDSASMMYGRLLSWNTVITPTTTRECLADQMPPIGWPGLAHPGCRCWPGAPVPGAPMVGGSRVTPRQRARTPAYA